nr:hypothetical protein BaRGS_030899 [Batillaria attramentaria]
MHVLCLLLLFFSQVPVTQAFQWTSAGSLPNGTTIPACPGQDVTLLWSYTADVAEHLTNVEWHHTTPAIADAGTYSVHVNMEVHGVVDREVQSVEVQVSDQPITTDGQLHVTMLPDAVYVNSTRHYHVQLACGDFLPTPDNQILSSTSDENGRFLLSVPNPVVSGEYSCVIDDTSPASLCVPSGSPLQRGATVNVDGAQAQLVIIEARMNSYQQENAALKQQLETQQASSEQDITALKHQLETQKQQLETQKQQLETQKASSEQDITALKQQLETQKQEDVALHQQLETTRHNLTSMIGK